MPPGVFSLTGRPCRTASGNSYNVEQLFVAALEKKIRYAPRPAITTTEAMSNFLYCARSSLTLFLRCNTRFGEVFVGIKVPFLLLMLKVC